MLAMTSSMIPRAFNPSPSVNDLAWSNPASLPPRYPPKILLKKEAPSTTSRRVILLNDPKLNDMPMVAKKIGARKPIVIPEMLR